MYPGKWAEEFPDKPASFTPQTASTVTYRELNARSNQLAQLMWAEGLRPGDHAASLHGKQPALLRGGLGGAALGSVPHHHQPLPDRTRKPATSSTTAKPGCSSPPATCGRSQRSCRVRAELQALADGGRAADGYESYEAASPNTRPRPWTKSRRASSCSTAPAPPADRKAFCGP